MLFRSGPYSATQSLAMDVVGVLVILDPSSLETDLLVCVGATSGKQAQANIGEIC